MILSDTVHLRLTKAKFTLMNVRTISATDWVNSSPLRDKFIKGCFMMVNTSVHLQRTEIRCYQKPGVTYTLFIFEIFPCVLLKFSSGITFGQWFFARSNSFPSVQIFFEDIGIFEWIQYTDIDIQVFIGLIYELRLLLCYWFCLWLLLLLCRIIQTHTAVATLFSPSTHYAAVKRRVALATVIVVLFRNLSSLCYSHLKLILHSTQSLSLRK